MQTRRRFVQMVPLAGVAALTACGEKTAPPAGQSPIASPAPTPNAMPPAATPAETTPTPTAAAPAAATGQMVDPGDAAAVALGYVANATTTKNAKYTPGAACANCALFGGKTGDASGPCPLFVGKLVASAGWCTAYAKKA